MSTQRMSKDQLAKLEELQSLCNSMGATQSTYAKLNAIEQQRRAAKQTRLSVCPDDETIDATRIKFNQLLLSTFDELSDEDTPLSTIQELMEKRSAELVRLSKAYKNDTRPTKFNGEVQNFIFALNNIAIRQLHELARKSPDLYMKHVKGEERGLWMSFSSHKATVSLNRATLPFEVTQTYAEAEKHTAYRNKKSSLRGENGSWAALLEFGYLIDKKNYDCYGNENPNGKDTRICINLDWIFGYSLNVIQESETLKAPFRGENFTLDTLKDYNLSKIQNSDENFKGEAAPLEIVPTTVGENKEDKAASGGSPLKKENEKEIAHAPDFLMIEAQKDTKTILTGIYSQKRLEMGQIRTNEVTVCTEIRNQDIVEMPYWIVQNYQLAHRVGEDWTVTIERVRMAISRKINYLNAYSSGRIYPPAMWLSPAMTAMTKYTLRWYIQNHMHGFEKKEPVLSSFDPKSPNPVIWLMDKGAPENWIKGIVERNGEDFVLNCIRYAKAKINNGLELKNKKPNAIIGYIIGVINRKDKDAIAERATIEENRKKPIWTVERIANVLPNAIKTAEWRKNVTPEIMQRIAQDIAFRNVSEAQVAALLYDIAKGIKTKYNS